MEHMSESGSHIDPGYDQGNLTEKIGSAGEYTFTCCVYPGMCSGFVAADKSNKLSYRPQEY